MAYDLDSGEAAPAESPFVPVLQLAVDVLELLVRRWWMVLAGTLIGAGVAHHISSKLPDTYVSSVKVIVDEPPAQPVPGADPTDLQAERRMALQRRIEAIRSIPVADTVHRILTGKLDFKAGASLGEIASAPAAPDESAGGPKVQDLVDLGLEERLKDPTYLSNLLAIRANIQVNADVDSLMLTISEYGTDPEALTARPNAYYQAYRAHCLAQKTAYDRRALRATQSSLSHSRQLLARAEALETAYRRKHQLKPRGQETRERGSPSPGASAEVARLLASQAQAQGGGSVEARLQARAEKGIQMRQTILAEALRSLDQLLDLEEEFPAESTALTAKQLEILGLQDSLGELDGALSQSATLRRQTYERELAEHLTTAVQGGPERGAFVLAHTVTIADSLYSALQSQQREIQVRNALAVPDIHLVEPATVPRDPVGPDRAKNIRNGAGMGFAAVFVLLLLLEYGDARVKGASAVTKITGSPVIATFAHDQDLEARPAEESIVLQEGSFSPLAESMRELRARLMFSGAPATSKALLVTSAFSGDGKTFVASNLALSLAQVGERVLLIDGDLRKPRLHHVFGVPNLRGFSDLADPERIHELVRSCVLPNLHVLTSGPAIPAPAEFLSRARTQEVLKALLARYDRVIFDTPPINLVADASSLAGLSDAVVLVIRDGGCTESELAAAAERVKRSGVKLAGVVLNHLRQTAIPYYGAAGRNYYPSMREPVSHTDAPAPRS